MNYIYLGVFILLAFFTVSIKLSVLLNCHLPFTYFRREDNSMLLSLLSVYRLEFRPYECKFVPKVMYHWS